MKCSVPVRPSPMDLKPCGLGVRRVRPLRQPQDGLGDQVLGSGLLGRRHALDAAEVDRLLRVVRLRRHHGCGHRLGLAVDPDDRSCLTLACLWFPAATIPGNAAKASTAAARWRTRVFTVRPDREAEVDAPRQTAARRRARAAQNASANWICSTPLRPLMKLDALPLGEDPSTDEKAVADGADERDSSCSGGRGRTAPQPIWNKVTHDERPRCSRMIGVGADRCTMDRACAQRSDSGDRQRSQPTTGGRRRSRWCQHGRVIAFAGLVSWLNGGHGWNPPGLRFRA